MIWPTRPSDYWEGALDVDAEELRKRLLAMRLRVGDETLRYIQARLAGGSRTPRPFPVLAQDARTGRPLRNDIDPAVLAGEQLGLF
jgi:hypothetical protein